MFRKKERTDRENWSARVVIDSNIAFGLYRRTATDRDAQIPVKHKGNKMSVTIEDEGIRLPDGSFVKADTLEDTQDFYVRRGLGIKDFFTRAKLSRRPYPSEEI